MCTGGCAKCLGSTLIPLALFGFLANILLFFPGGRVIDNNDHLSEEVWFFGGILGSGVLMIFPALVFLGLKNNDCCGCCGNESCGKRFAVSSRRQPPAGVTPGVKLVPALIPSRGSTVHLGDS
uniref:Transmembrane 4 L six family member 4 n=1 Tax=Canis lupus dingo TaxID=286419 RepID=A0A8C0R4L1_CANLU